MAYQEIKQELSQENDKQHLWQMKNKTHQWKITPMENNEKALNMIWKPPINYIYNLRQPKEEPNPFGVSTSQLKDVLTAPITLEEAWFHDHPICRKRWRDAINLELRTMKDIKV
jgi:hypothetical protein